LCFIGTFEALLACDVIGVGEFLGVELRILQKPESPKLQAQLDEKEAWKGMIASIFAQGIVVKDISTIEVENVLSTRDQLEDLRSLALVVLRRKDSRLVMSPITASWGVGGHRRLCLGGRTLQLHLSEPLPHDAASRAQRTGVVSRQRRRPSLAIPRYSSRFHCPRTLGWSYCRRLCHCRPILSNQAVKTV
jgi:hypothetical protein